MTLPDLTWQIAYGRLAWAVVAAAVLIAAWPRAWRLPRLFIAAIVLVSAVLHALPGEAGLAYWLGLALQWPSAALAAFCCARLWSAWQGERRPAPMPAGLALLIAGGGALLYLDAIGVAEIGIYYWGFGHGAAALGVLLAVLCALAAVRNHGRPFVLAIVAAVAVFALLRLPTGNLWDALLDPLLWAWGIAALVRSLAQRLRTRKHVAVTKQFQPQTEQFSVKK